jgi:hypothetical protein
MNLSQKKKHCNECNANILTDFHIQINEIFIELLH